jgi:hypothetical protein
MESRRDIDLFSRKITPRRRCARTFNKGMPVRLVIGSAQTRQLPRGSRPRAKPKPSFNQLFNSFHLYDDAGTAVSGAAVARSAGGLCPGARSPRAPPRADAVTRATRAEPAIHIWPRSSRSPTPAPALKVRAPMPPMPPMPSTSCYSFN